MRTVPFIRVFEACVRACGWNVDSPEVANRRGAIVDLMNDWIRRAYDFEFWPETMRVVKRAVEDGYVFDYANPAGSNLLVSGLVEEPSLNGIWTPRSAEIDGYPAWDWPDPGVAHVRDYLLARGEILGVGYWQIRDSVTEAIVYYQALDADGVPPNEGWEYVYAGGGGGAAL